MKIFSSTIRILSSAVLVACGMMCQSAFAQNQQYSWSIIAGQTISTNHLPGHVDGTNGNASFYNPWSITADNKGTLYVAEFDDIRQIQKIGSDWVVTTLSLTNGIGSFQWIAADNSGNLFTTYQAGGPLMEFSRSGPNWSASHIGSNCTYPFTNVFDCWNPGTMVPDNKGNLFVTDTRYGTIKKMNFDGTNWIVDTIAGTPNVNRISADGTNEQAGFNEVRGITVDKNGNLYITDDHDNTIRRIAPEGTNWVVTTIAGLAGDSRPYIDVDGTNQQARFTGPWAITADSKGTLYVLDQPSDYGSPVRKITPVGTNWVVTTIANGNPDLFHPLGITVDNADNLYIADSANCTIWLGKLLPSLQAVRNGNQVVISWPSSASNYVLESTSTLNDSESWVPVTGATTVGNSFTVSSQLNGSGTFFRLRQQSAQ